MARARTIGRAMRGIGAAVLLVALAGCSVTGAPTPTPAGTVAATSLPASPAAGATAARVAAPSPATSAASPAARATPATPRPATPAAAASPATPAPGRVGNPLVLTGQTGAVTVVAWSPGGSSFAAGGGTLPDKSDHTIRMWRADGTLVATLAGHTNLVTSLAWSPDGRTLASGALDGTVRLWSDTGQPRATIAMPGEREAVFNMAWSPDGSLLAVGTILPAIPRSSSSQPIPGTVRLYRPDGTLGRTLAANIAGSPYLGTGGKFVNLAWTRDGSLLAAGAVTYAVWRPDGTVVGTIYQGGTPAWGMAWSPDGAYLAIGDENGDVDLYTPVGKGVAGWSRNGGAYSSLAFSPDGRTLAVGTSYSLRLLNVADPHAAPLVLGTGTDANVAWSHDGRLAAATRANPASPDDNVVAIWRTDGTPLPAFAGCPGGAIHALAWAPDGKALVAGGDTGAVCLWSAER
ncbi:MAG TPA: WD40 repeat domain-containing protein [Thermomicrobiales bacterium]|nr:WD40 repeat domain-containing protein [Thermomicrobiales bacterium]